MAQLTYIGRILNIPLKEKDSQKGSFYPSSLATEFPGASGRVRCALRLLSSTGIWEGRAQPHSPAHPTLQPAGTPAPSPQGESRYFFISPPPAGASLRFHRAALPPVGLPWGDLQRLPPSATPPAVPSSEGQPGCSPLACCHPTDPNRHPRSPSPPFTSLFYPAAPGPCPVGQQAPGVAPHGKGRAGGRRLPVPRSGARPAANGSNRPHPRSRRPPLTAGPGLAPSVSAGLAPRRDRPRPGPGGGPGAGGALRGERGAGAAVEAAVAPGCGRCFWGDFGGSGWVWECPEALWQFLLVLHWKEMHK